MRIPTSPHTVGGESIWFSDPWADGTAICREALILLFPAIQAQRGADAVISPLNAGSGRSTGQADALVTEVVREMDRLNTRLAEARERIGRIIFGQTQVIDETLITLLAGGAAAHLVYVLIASFVAHVCPVHSVHFFLSVASLLASAVYLGARNPSIPVKFAYGLVLERVSPYHVAHHEKSYSPAKLERWIQQVGGMVCARGYAGLVPFFCPDWFAKLMKRLEPAVERTPLLNALGCAVCVFLVRRIERA